MPDGKVSFLDPLNSGVGLVSTFSPPRLFSGVTGSPNFIILTSKAKNLSQIVSQLNYVLLPFRLSG
jgi:hypothetical protein